MYFITGGASNGTKYQTVAELSQRTKRTGENSYLPSLGCLGGEKPKGIKQFRTEHRQRTCLPPIAMHKLQSSSAHLCFLTLPFPILPLDTYRENISPSQQSCLIKKSLTEPKSCESTVGSELKRNSHRQIF